MSSAWEMYKVLDADWDLAIVDHELLIDEAWPDPYDGGFTFHTSVQAGT
jgi:hypothetical protein